MSDDYRQDSPPAPSDPIIRRPPAWRELDPLDIACAAALGVEPQRVRPDLLLVESTPGSTVAASAPCPLIVVETFHGVAVRVYDPLRPAIENLVRQAMKRGAVLSPTHRKLLVETVQDRLPVVEVWHDLLHYTDREHFAPSRQHKVRRIAGADKQQRRSHWSEARLPFAAAYGIYMKGELAAYADIVTRGEHACSIGVFTEPQYRGQGMGRSVVSTATRAILKAGRIPLYSSDESNLASLTVCRYLGYLKFGRSLYCFLAPEQERARREQAEREAEREATDYALRRWIID